MPLPIFVALATAAVGAVTSAAAVVGTAAVAAAGAAATAAITVGPWVAAGAAILGGAALTKAVIERNRQARDRAYEEAEAQASQERAKEAAKKAKEYQKKLEKIKQRAGGDISSSQREELLVEASTIAGGLDGNIDGLKKNGETVPDGVEQAKADLDELLKQSGLEK